MKKGTRQLISPNQWLCSILEALYMHHGKVDSPPMPFSIARSAIFRHGRATCMYYSEVEDFQMCSIRKIDEANLKVSRVANFLFEFKGRFRMNGRAQRVQTMQYGGRQFIWILFCDGSIVCQFVHKIEYRLTV
jgi:hypothetical protein